MTIRKRLTTLLLAALAVAALALPAAAKDKTVTIIDDDGVTYVCTYVDGEHLRVVNKDTGEQVLDFDIEEMEQVIEDAMEEVESALEELEDLELDLHFGEDSFVRFEMGDERVFVDVDGIVSTVMDALKGLEGMDIRVNDFEWDGDGHGRHHDHDGKSSLEDELKQLRHEVRELKRELREAERRSRH